MKHGVAANFHPFVDEAVGPDVGAFADFRRFGHYRRRMNSGRVLLWRVKEFQSTGEIEVRISRPQCSERRKFRIAFERHLAPDKYRRCPGRRQFAAIFGVR